MTDSPRPTAESPAKRVIEFAADRLVHVYGDSENADFIQALQRLAIEAEAAALSDSALREALAEVVAAWRNPQKGEAAGDRLVVAIEDAEAALLAQPTPDDKPSLDALPEHLRGDGPCSVCGTLDNIGWFTDNVLWNAVTGEFVVHENKPVGILCINCFVIRADRIGLRPTGWRLLAEWPWRYRYGVLPAVERLK